MISYFILYGKDVGEASSLAASRSGEGKCDQLSDDGKAGLATAAPRGPRAVDWVISKQLSQRQLTRNRISLSHPFIIINQK